MQNVGSSGAQGTGGAQGPGTPGYSSKGELGRTTSKALSDTEKGQSPTPPKIHNANDEKV